MITFVATPIGNLKDITLRALEELKEADVIFCEDTRHTIHLLSAYEIKKPLLSCHKFNERDAAKKMIELSREGKRVAVVSDAGMPVISDPGNVVCQILKEEGEPYTVLPGACAFVCALVLSAFSADKFTFVGFLPEKTGQRREMLKSYIQVRNTLIFHCAPQDLDAYVSLMFEAFGNRRACVVREITKIHEESVVFQLGEGYRGEKRGECILLVEGAKEEENPHLALTPREHVAALMQEGLDKKEALKRAAKERGVPKNELYKETLDL